MLRFMSGANAVLGVVNLVLFVITGSLASLVAAVLSAGAFLLLWSQR